MGAIIRHSGPRAALIAAVLSTACGFSFDPQSLIKYRRIVAMRAEPPEVLVGFDSSGLPQLTSSTVTVSALVLDPTDNGTPTPYVWRNCSETLSDVFGSSGGQWDSYNLRCAENDQTNLANGSEPLADLACETPGASSRATDVTTCPAASVITLNPFSTLVALATGGAGLGGVGGSGGGAGGGGSSSLQQIEQGFAGASSGLPSFSVWLDAQLRIDDGKQAALYAYKRVVVSPAAPGKTPNHNPKLSGLLFDYQVWEPHPSSMLTIHAGNCQASTKVDVPNPNGKGTVSVCQHTITPIFDPTQDEAYAVQTFNKDSSGHYVTLNLKEYLRFQWYIDQGQVDNDATSEPTNIGPQSYDPVSTHWAEPAKPTGATINVWVVTTDGRGGETWDKRQVVVTP